MPSEIATNLAFYALDESESPETNVISMTGLFVPASHFAEVPRRFYGFLHALASGAGAPPGPSFELHGSALLKGVTWADDTMRLSCYRFVVALVNELSLRVRRAGYYRHSVKQVTEHDPKLHGLNFLNMLWMIQPELRDYSIIPVMDGLNERVANRMGTSAHFIHEMVGRGDEAMLSISNASNLCELYFVSSKHSALVQLVDMISYMLHLRDLRTLGKPVSDFKRRVLDIAEQLDERLLRNEVVEMKFRDGSTTPA